MATPLLQEARLRKMIYFGAIVAIFTVSLVHREFVVKPQAYQLQLLEATRGEVKLTSSAVRLMLTGSRGFAVTFLWYTAMDKQKRNEWNELELLVESITQLQPHFITPWLYQSWNISFNVAVECDKPRDKYYYISRGLELLAEGERRNSGTAIEGAPVDPLRPPFPGNPELRHFMGFTYQLKMGTSDERLTMRCLLELSCIDPIERDPERFGTTNVDLAKFAVFCQKYPRLVRRLSEQLAYSKPEQIVKFLQEHQGIPNRYVPIDKAKLSQMTVSELKRPREQFPILPPFESGWPDASKPEMTEETVDVYLMCRTWYEFAQKPLPPPSATPGIQAQDYDKMKYRVPKQMVTQIFRQYPARAQVYIAETLESEGWFDSDGWKVPDWFAKFKGRLADDFLKDGEFITGTEPKYHSSLAWQKGYLMYKRFGELNGVYLAPGEIVELEKTAKFCREQLKLDPTAMPQIRSDMRQGEMGKSLDAHMKLYYHRYLKNLVNFDAFFYQSEAESDPITVAARKLMFFAERKRRRDTPSEAMLALYEEAWPLYIQAALMYPKFAQVTSMQEDLYEIHQRYMRRSQDVRKDRFVKTAVWAAKHAFWPQTDWQGALIQFSLVSQAEKDEAQMVKVIPFRKRMGPLDWVHYYDGPQANDLRGFLFAWTQGANLAGTWSMPSLYPGHSYHLLTRYGPAENTISAATNASPIVITSSAHGLTTGQKVNLYGMQGNTSASGGWTVTVLNAHQFSLDKSAGNGAYTSGGFWFPAWWHPIITSESRRIAANRLGLDRLP